MPRDGSGRPVLDAPLRSLVATLARRAPAQLGHVDPASVLIVAGSARRSSMASIRGFPEGEAYPRIERRGALMRYEICLRPQFFLRASAEERLELLVHELWHAHPAFDGRLDDRRRHSVAEPEEAHRFVATVLASVGPPPPVLDLAPEIRLSAWLDRPPSFIPDGMSCRRSYDESDLFSAVIRCGTSSRPAT